MVTRVADKVDLVTPDLQLVSDLACNLDHGPQSSARCMSMIEF
jgi:hypothetical protein